MRKAAAALAACAALAAGCGGGPSANDVLRETAAHVKDIRSGTLALRLVLEPRGGAVAAGRIGFALAGPVDLRATPIPIARLRYTQIAGAHQGEATFISTGRAAYVEIGGRAYRLPGRQTAALRSSAATVQRGVELPVGRWVRNPRRDDGGVVGGAETDHVGAQLDAVAALRDIFGAARAAGAQVPDLSGARGDQLRGAIDQSTIDLWSGRSDHLLRRLRLRIAFKAAAPPALRARLGDVAGGRLAFDVDVANPNRPVQVAPPADARPASELPGR